MGGEGGRLAALPGAVCSAAAAAEPVAASALGGGGGGLVNILQRVED